MLLSGDFEDLDPVAVLQLLSSSRKTGALAAMGEEEVTLYFYEGDLYHAETPSVAPLVSTLSATGVVDPDRWAEAFAAAGSGGIGQDLIESGTVEVNVLTAAVRHLVVQVLSILLRMPAGRFEFRSEEKHPFGPVACFPVDAMVAEVHVGPTAVDGPLEGVLALAPALCDSLRAVTLTAEEWRAVAAVGEGTTVIGISLALRWEPADAEAILGRLVARGMVRVGERRGSDRPWTAETELVEQELRALNDGTG